MAGEPTITVTGNLGNDAELKVTPNGTSVTSFSLANTPRKQKNGEWVNGETNWFRVFVWGNDAAGAATTFRKGDKVIVTGRLQFSFYTDKEGKEHKNVEINADTVGVVPRHVPEFVPPKPNRSDEEPVEDFPW